MVKIHPQSSNNHPPPPPPPPPPPRRQTSVCTPKLLQLSFCLCVVLCVTLIVLVVVFASMFGVRSEVDVRVTGAALSEFAAETKNDTILLSYDLAYSLAMRNPNGRMGVYYENITAFAFYNDEMLGRKNLAPFYQRHKTTDTLRAVFDGNKMVSFGDGLFSQFAEEERSGVFSIVAAIAVTVRTKHGRINYRHTPTYIDCHLRVPLRGKSSYGFETTQCGVVHIISYPNN